MKESIGSIYEFDDLSRPNGAYDYTPGIGVGKFDRAADLPIDPGIKSILNKDVVKVPPCLDAKHYLEIIS
ncbi:hypothetical protein ACFLQL_02315 [Verrucomicrobiota bacterium]